MVAGGDMVEAFHANTRIATTLITTDSAAYAAAEVVLATVSGLLIAGETYSIKFWGNISSDVVNDTSLLRIREDSGNQLNVAQLVTPGTSTIGFTNTVEAEYTATGTGVKGFNLTGQRVGGTGLNHHVRAGAGRVGIFKIELILP